MAGSVSPVPDARTAYRGEPRWPVVFAVLAVCSLLMLLPARVRTLPPRTPLILIAVIIAPMIGAGIKGASDRRWLVLERTVSITAAIVLGVVNLLILLAIVRAMVSETGQTSGIQLLSSGSAVWLTNILVFSLAYWQLDRGGPEARANGSRVLPDFLFPNDSAPDHVLPDWKPAYVDYLALSFATATAFSPTDVPPLTPAAKLLLMAESLISLATLAMIVSRAVNVLGA
jgi:uncharacterized membrane protein